MKEHRFIVVVRQTGASPQWSRERITSEIASNFEYEGFEAKARILKPRTKRSKR